MPSAFSAPLDSALLTGKVDRIPLLNYAYYLKTNPTVTIDSVAKLLLVYVKAEPFTRINLGYTSDVIWLIVPFNSISKNTDWLLEVANSQIDKVQAYCVTKNSIRPLGSETGDDLPFHNRTVRFRNFVWPINACKTTDFWIIVRLEKLNSSMTVPAYLWRWSSYHEHETKSMIFFGICFGMMLLAALYSLLGGLVYRSKASFLYFLFILSIILLLATGEGLSFQFLYPQTHGFNSLFRVIAVGISSGLLLAFSQSFLSIALYSKRIQNVLNVAIGIYISLIVCTPFLKDFFLQNSQILVPLVISIAVFSNLLCALAAILSYRSQKEISLFYLVAYSATWITGIIVALEDFGWIEKFQFNLFFIGALVEILVFSLGLTYKMRQIIDERNLLSIKIVRQQKETLTAYVSGIEKERERIAGELHDDIGSRLANLTRMIRLKKPDTNFIENQVETISTDIRKLSHELASPAIKLVGLMPLLTQLVSDISIAGKTTFNLQHYDLPENLPENVVQQIYRVIQEACSNIVKHAEANHADIQLFYRNNELIITLEDDGRGFYTATHSKGIGLTQMKSRIESLNGNFEICSTPNKGTQLMLTIPLA